MLENTFFGKTNALWHGSPGLGHGLVQPAAVFSASSLALRNPPVP